MANDSVSSMPTCSASRSLKRVPFSLWSGQAGYPNAGRMPRNFSATSSSGACLGPRSYQSRRATSCRYSAKASARRSASALTRIARVGVELARRGAHLRVVEDGREAALELPGVEEERPVDVRDHRSELGLDHAQAGEGRLLQDVKAEAGAILAGRFQREDGPRHLLRVLQPQLLLQLAVLRIQDRLAPGIE